MCSAYLQSIPNPVQHDYGLDTRFSAHRRLMEQRGVRTTTVDYGAGKVASAPRSEATKCLERAAMPQDVSRSIASPLPAPAWASCTSGSAGAYGLIAGRLHAASH